MRYRPILMTGRMVTAARRGFKTQTRRIVKPQPVGTAPVRMIPDNRAPDGTAMFNHAMTEGEGYETQFFHCPYGIDGDRLWVRETFCIDDTAAQEDGSKLVWYRADFTEKDAMEAFTKAGSPWKPSIHMPRWACRLVVEVVSLRIERLQDISEEDAIAEGIPHTGDRIQDGKKCCHGVSVVGEFRKLWESINGPGSWDANPYVWVVEFKPVRERSK